MQKKQVAIVVKQQIVYAETNETDRWQHETTADLLELETFSKLTYTDERGQLVHVKWQWLASEATWLVEVKQGQNVLRFDTTQTTACHYMTPQGTWPMTIDTQSVRLGFEKNTADAGVRRQLHIHYQLKVDNQLLGTYYFSVVFE